MAEYNSYSLSFFFLLCFFLLSEKEHLPTLSGLSTFVKILIAVTSVIVSFFVLYFTLDFPIRSSGIVYVASDVSSSGPGYSWWPTRHLNTTLLAMSTREDGDRQIIFSGEHSDTYIVPDNMTLIGAGDTPTIVGTFVITASATLSDFTITGNGDGIYMKDGSTLTARRMVITENTGDGIDAQENATIHLSDSTVHHNRKGLYVRKGSNTTLTDSLIANNRQEGIDLRSRSISRVENNIIRNNAESGIEYITGGSTTILKGNVITGNKKSGVVVEFSNLAPETGELRILSNEITDNGSHGIRCTSRTGGTRVYRYFAKSVLAQGNSTSNNTEGDVTSLCKFGSVPFLSDVEKPTSE